MSEKLCLFINKMTFNDPWAARHDRQKVDLVFIVDCTGSMGPYIKQAQKHIRTIAETVSRTAFSVKLALVEYKDHPPQDRTFITRVHDFTLSLSDMKTWVDGMRASGGGDGPESVACALHEATKLSFREDSTKMCVLIGKVANKAQIKLSTISRLTHNTKERAENVIKKLFLESLQIWLLILEICI